MQWNACVDTLLRKLKKIYLVSDFKINFWKIVFWKIFLKTKAWASFLILFLVEMIFKNIKISFNIFTKISSFPKKNPRYKFQIIWSLFSEFVLQKSFQRFSFYCFHQNKLVSKTITENQFQIIWFCSQNYFCKTVSEIFMVDIFLNLFYVNISEKNLILCEILKNHFR